MSKREDCPNDCTSCAKAPGIWTSRSDPAFYVCDDCFAPILRERDVLLARAKGEGEGNG